MTTPKPVGRISPDGFSFMSEEIYKAWRDPKLNPRAPFDLEPVFTAVQISDLFEEQRQWSTSYWPDDVGPKTKSPLESFVEAYCPQERGKLKWLTQR